MDLLRVGAVRAGVEFESGQLNAVADFLDGRGNDRSGVEGMAEFQMHTAADVLKLQHGSAPGGSGDGDLHGLGTEFGMAREKRFAASQQDSCVAVVHGLDLKDGGRRKVIEKDATLDFRLDDTAVHFVRQVGVRAKHINDWG